MALSKFAAALSVVAIFVVRIRNVVVVGSPGVQESQFAGADVLIQDDPASGSHGRARIAPRHNRSLIFMRSSARCLSGAALYYRDSVRVPLPASSV